MELSGKIKAKDVEKCVENGDIIMNDWLICDFEKEDDEIVLKITNLMKETKQTEFVNENDYDGAADLLNELSREFEEDFKEDIKNSKENVLLKKNPKDLNLMWFYWKKDKPTNYKNEYIYNMMRQVYDWVEWGIPATMKEKDYHNLWEWFGKVVIKRGKYYTLYWDELAYESEFEGKEIPRRMKRR